MKTGTKLATGTSESDNVSRQKQTRRSPSIPGFNPRPEDSLASHLRALPPERLVVAAGVLSILIYALFVVAFPITKWWQYPHAASDPNAINDLGRITGYSPFAAIAFVVAIFALFACQFMALVGAGRVKQLGKPEDRADRIVRRGIILFPLIFAAIMIWMQPVTTTDLYGYVARGYLFAHLHQNPMTTVATQLPGGASVDRPAAPYGPLWLLITWVVSQLTGENLLLNMLLYKAIGFAAMGAALWLVDLLARQLYPERRLRIYVLFGWSPLLLFESIGNGHNDIVMVVCVLAAFALMLRGWARTSFALLVIGALIKYFSAVFVALWLVYELRHRIQTSATKRQRARAPTLVAHETAAEAESASPSIALSRWLRELLYSLREVDRRKATLLLAQVSLIGAVLVVLCYAPFWRGLETFKGLGTQLQPLYYNGSLVGFFTAPLRLFVPTNEYSALDKTVRLVFYTLFAVYTYLQVQRLWFLGAACTMRDIITAAAKITFAALILITFWYQPWYVCWLLPLAALADAPFVRRQGTMLAFGSLLTYAVGNFLLVGESGLGHDFFVQFFEILVTFAPLLLLRGAPYDQGWRGVLRRYAGLLERGLSQRPIFWERLMLVLIVVVAAGLRLVRLGNLFSAVAPSTSETGILKDVSGDLELTIADTQGLHGPFVMIQNALIHIFGPTPLAILLPSAVIGSVTVIAIYLLTYEIMRQGNLPGQRVIALLAALLAATSRWHVSLSRSGMEVVLLPLLMCLAIYWLLRALRTSPSSAASAIGATDATGITGPVRLPRPDKAAMHGKRHHHRQRPAPARFVAQTPPPSRRQRLLLYIGCGICTGLACDVAPGLWLVPLLVAGMLALWHWRRPLGMAISRQGVLVVSIATMLTAIPVIWHYLDRVIGFPRGSSFLARTSVPAVLGPGVFSAAFWGQVASNAGAVLSLLRTQDYSAGYPAVGGAPIIPTLLGPLFFIGVIIIIFHWHNFASLALLLLIALPLVASIAVGTPTGVIEAASVLPAMCIAPALAIYEIASWLGHLPIVLDRVNGARIFSTPEQIGRVLLLLFLTASAIRTFFWYFEVTLPATPQQFIPSSIGSNIAAAQPGVTVPQLTLVTPARSHVILVERYSHFDQEQRRV